MRGVGPDTGATHERFSLSSNPQKQDQATSAVCVYVERCQHPVCAPIENCAKPHYRLDLRPEIGSSSHPNGPRRSFSPADSAILNITGSAKAKINSE